MIDYIIRAGNSALSDKEGAMGTERDLKAAINRTAHVLAQQQFQSIRMSLVIRVQEMRARGMSCQELMAWLEAKAVGKAER